MNREMSIVIPVYNRQHYLRRTLASIAEQSYAPIHVLLVDNGSTDDSLSICREWAAERNAPGFRVTVLQELKAGANAARNRGLAAVTGDYVMFFDSDDCLAPDAVARYMEAFRKYPDADIIGSRRVLVTADGRRHVQHKPCSRRVAQQIFHSILSTQTFAVRTEVVRAVGGWDEELMRWQDWNLGVRLMLHTRKIVWLKGKPVSEVWLHDDSITGNSYSASASAIERSIRHTRRAIASCNCPNRERLLKLVDYKTIVVAALYAREGSPSGRNLYRKTMQLQLDRWLSWLYAFCYHFTRKGGRGTAILADLFIH